MTIVLMCADVISGNIRKHPSPRDRRWHRCRHRTDLRVDAVAARMTEAANVYATGERRREDIAAIVANG